MGGFIFDVRLLGPCKKACRGNRGRCKACLGRCKACRGRPRTLPSMPRSCQASLHILSSHKNNAINEALSQVAKSPFTRNIEDASLPRRFHQPTFALYNGRTDPVEHVSHFSQKMAVHSRDEALMCKIFLSSLGLMAMRWFNGLKSNSIDSFKKLTQSFGARFITCSRVPLPLGSLLSMSMQDGETLKAYSDRYWKMFNKIDGSYDDVAISTFKAGLLAEHDLRKSLTGKPIASVRQLMDMIDKYRRIEEDQLQGKGKAKMIP